MDRIDAYTQELLVMAYSACKRDGGSFIVYDEPHGCRVSCWNRDGNNGPDGRGTSLADALAALLRDLGVEVPERPTAERRDEVWQHLNEAEHNGEFLDGMRDYPDRLAVLALLEEGT